MVKDNPESIMEAVRVSWEKGAMNVEPEGTKYYFTVTRIGDFSYVNLFYDEGIREFQLKKAASFATWAKSEKRRCTILRYECSAKKLLIWNVNEKVLDKLQKEGQLKETDGLITVNDLQQYLGKNGGQELFSDEPTSYVKNR
jgi:hypothetical protein